MESFGLENLLVNFWQLVVALGRVLVNLLFLALHWSLLIAWIAWWLWGVNWRRAWPVLAAGAWVPVALLVLIASLVWSRMAPGTCECIPGVTLANFWWQLGAVTLLTGLALFCGWLQGIFGWAPAEISFEPPPLSDDLHGHEHPVGTFHGHEAAHADEPAE